MLFQGIGAKTDDLQHFFKVNEAGHTQATTKKKIQKKIAGVKSHLNKAYTPN